MKLKSETIQKYLLILSLIVNIGITFYYNFLAENFSFKTYPLEYISWGITFIIIFFIILFNNKIIISNNNQNNHKKEKTIIRIGLGTIILLFCLIKIPFIHLPFSNNIFENKYLSYIQPAQHMLEKGAFVYEKEYLKSNKGNPFENNAEYKTFSSYPILERTFASTKYIFPQVSREILSRIIMMIIGCILLISIYYFLNHFLEKKQTLLILILLTINPIFQFFTFLTVLDPINLIILFFSLHLLIKGLKNKNSKLLYLTGVLAGIGICIKYHAIIFYLPLFISILYFYKKFSHEEKLANSLLILPNFILQTVFFWLSVRYLPSQAIALPLTGLMILIQIYLYIQSSIIHHKIANLIQKIGTKKIYYILISIITLSICSIFFIPQFTRMGNNFLTDQYLIFNKQVYTTIITKNISLVSRGLYSVYLLFLVLIPLLPFPKKTKLLGSTLFITGIIYSIIASKILYNHHYYHHIHIITITIFASFFYIITNIYNKLSGKIFIIFLFITSIGIKNLGGIKHYLGSTSPNKTNIANYIKENTSEKEKFLYNNNINATISFYAQRNFYHLNNTTKSEFIKEYKTNSNIINIIQNHNIKFLITCPTNNFNNNWRYDIYKGKQAENYKIPEVSRKILCETKNLYCDTLPEKQTPTPEATEFFNNNILPHLFLEKQIGDCGIYSFK